MIKTEFSDAVTFSGIDRAEFLQSVGTAYDQDIIFFQSFSDGFPQIFRSSFTVRLADGKYVIFETFPEKREISFFSIADHSGTGKFSGNFFKR